jgi:hypothetical protein
VKRRRKAENDREREEKEVGREDEGGVGRRKGRRENTYLNKQTNNKCEMGYRDMWREKSG